MGLWQKNGYLKWFCIKQREVILYVSWYKVGNSINTDFVSVVLPWCMWSTPCRHATVVNLLRCFLTLKFSSRFPQLLCLSVWLFCLNCLVLLASFMGTIFINVVLKFVTFLFRLNKCNYFLENHLCCSCLPAQSLTRYCNTGIRYHITHLSVKHFRNLKVQAQ